MNDPRRLRDDAESAVELLLLEAGVQPYKISEDARAKTLAALGLAGSAAVSAGALSAATSSLISKAGWTKLLLFSGLGASVVAPVGYVAWQHAHPQAIAVTAKAVAPRPVTAPVVVARAPVQDEEAAPAPAAPTPKVESRSTSANALAAELGALDAARSRLASGDPMGALAKLDDYAKVYPRGRLVLEAEVLRIDALSRAGQRDQAKKRAETFLRRHPNSVLATRVRGYLD